MIRLPVLGGQGPGLTRDGSVVLGLGWAGHQGEALGAQGRCGPQSPVV